MRTVWKNIRGYAGVYRVSDLGTFKKVVIENFVHDGKSTPVRSQTLLEGSINKGGYCVISLTKNKKTAVKLAHRLVAKAFIPNPENKPYVNHINGIKTDNRVANLEWVTHLENCQHSAKIGLLGKNRKSKEVVVIEDGSQAPDRRLTKKGWRLYWQRRFSELNLESKGLKQNQQL